MHSCLWACTEWASGVTCIIVCCKAWQNCMSWSGGTLLQMTSPLIRCLQFWSVDKLPVSKWSQSTKVSLSKLYICICNRANQTLIWFGWIMAQTRSNEKLPIFWDRYKCYCILLLPCLAGPDPNSTISLFSSSKKHNNLLGINQRYPRTSTIAICKALIWLQTPDQFCLFTLH